MKPCLLLVVILSFIGSAYGAVPKATTSQPPNLKAAVLAEFVKQANDPKSALGASILQSNEGMKDGRNEHGGISMPVKAGDVRVIPIAVETITNPWHYGETKGEYRVASSGENSFLVLLTTRTNVHMAQEIDSLAFTVAARDLLKVKLPKDWDGGYDFQFEDAPAPILHSVEIGPFRSISLSNADKE